MMNIDDIIKALVTFDVVGSVRIRRICPKLYEITVNGEYYGIWDGRRKTFVD